MRGRGLRARRIVGAPDRMRYRRHTRLGGSALAQDCGDEAAAVRERIEKLLQETFAVDGFHLFDFEMLEKPKAISEDMRHFWGGYDVVFKLATADVHAAHGKDLNALRRMALNLGQGTRFSIDISRFEYVEDKEPADLEGYTIYVYSPVMIVCRKAAGHLPADARVRPHHQESPARLRAAARFREHLRADGEAEPGSGFAEGPCHPPFDVRREEGAARFPRKSARCV